MCDLTDIRTPSGFKRSNCPTRGLLFTCWGSRVPVRRVEEAGTEEKLKRTGPFSIISEAKDREEPGLQREQVPPTGNLSTALHAPEATRCATLLRQKKTDKAQFEAAHRHRRSTRLNDTHPLCSVESGFDASPGPRHATLAVVHGLDSECRSADTGPIRDTLSMYNCWLSCRCL